MCISPISIPTRSRVISQNFHERYYNTVPCGHCSECADKSRKEWQFRTFYESQRSKFIYYDTLTYSSDNLPRVSDFFDTDISQPCFCREHIKLFLKRLRRRLNRITKVSESNLKYFLTAEYGEKRKRPHYHILLFVGFEIDPLFFSRLVSDCWQYGRTDGLPYKSGNYVSQHNVLHSNSLRLTNYVAKYVQKSCSYSRVIEPIIENLKNSVDRRNFLTYSSYRSVLRSIPRFLRQFHLQSHHFGDNFLDSVDVRQLVICPFVSLYENGYILRIPCPLYYIRKLFYHKVDLFCGFSCYEPNELGLEYLEMLEYRKFDNVKSKLLKMSSSVGLSFPSRLDDVAHYFCYDRFSNCKPYIFLTPSEKLKSDFYINYYSDADIDINGKHVVGSSSDNVFYNGSTFFSSRKFVGKFEPYISLLLKLYSDFISSKDFKLSLVQRVREFWSSLSMERSINHVY